MRTPALLVLALLCGLAGPVAAREPRLTVRVTDAATGRPLADFACGLARPGSDAAYARFRGPAYAAGPAPQPGDTLHVFRRGYDPAVVQLAGGARQIDVALAPAKGRCTVLVEGSGAEACAVEFQILVRTPGRWRRAPIRESYVAAGRGARCELVVPRPASVSVLALARPGLVWPPAFDAEPGGARTLRYEAPRRVEVERDASFRLEAARVELVPDRLWRPKVAGARIDAWRWRLNRAAWLRDGIVGAAATLEVSPDVPFHLFASWRGRGVYRYVARADRTLDLRQPGPLRLVPARPVVDGRPAPAGAWLAPGRLDLYAAATLAELAAALDGCAVQLGPPDSEWTPPALPAAEHLTVWHPDAGLAYLRWPAAGVPRGRTSPGRVVLEPAAGHDASGRVSLFPVWRGTGAVQAVPPERMLRRVVDRGEPTEFRGLPPGRYGLHFQLTSLERKSGRVRSIRGTREIEIPEAHPVVRRKLPVR